MLLGLLAGCGTMGNGRGWGQDPTLRPGWDRVKSAAWNTASSPQIWLPAASALLLQINGADETLTDWAIETTPLYGSTRNAEHASDHIRNASYVFFGATVLATPSGDPSQEWTRSKLNGFAIQASASLLQEGLGRGLRSATGWG